MKKLVTRFNTWLILGFGLIGLILFQNFIAPDITVLPYSPAKIFPIHTIQGLKDQASEADGKGYFNTPYLPALRYTADGRIGLNTKVINSNYEFYLIRPEIIANVGKRTFSDLSPYLGNERIYRDPVSVSLSQVMSHLPLVSGKRPYINHATFCDPTAYFNILEESRFHTEGNPRVCDGGLDCYRMFLVGRAHVNSDPARSLRLFRIPVEVKVRNPKTIYATISEISFGAGTVSDVIPNVKAVELFEPLVVGDGRLLVGRLSNTVNEYVNYTDATNVRRSVLKVNIAYSTYPAQTADGSSTEVCDVTRWRNVYPISYAPHDTVNQMPVRYRFAQYKFRKPDGTLFPPHQDLGATYPWIDTKAANLFFTTIGGRGLYDSDGSTRFSSRCLVLNGCQSEDTSGTRGLAVMGFWTRGKAVLIDGNLNNNDYGLGANDENHALVRLYTDREVRVGVGRDNAVSPGRLQTRPSGWIFNTTIVDSIENRLNYIPEMHPVTARDLVWLVSSGKTSEEVIFDDYVHPGMLIFSDMTGLLTKNDSSTMFRYWDGYVNTDGSRNYSGNGVSMVQNAATPLPGQLAIPASGRVVGTNVRIEPVALGGVHGKGLWLSGDDSLIYQVPSNNEVHLKPWFTGVFIDRRSGNSDIFRRLLTFEPENQNFITTIDIRFRSTDAILRISDGVNSFTVNLPLKIDNRRWSHLGFLVSGGVLSIYQDGQLISKRNSFRGLLPVRGKLTIGYLGSSGLLGFRGWIDELKVFTQQNITPEEICNHARGTIIATNSSWSPQWSSIADRFPQNYNEVRQAIPSRFYGRLPTEYKFACYKNYSNKYPGNLIQAKRFGRSVRDYIIFPEKFVDPNAPNTTGLVFDHPRPDSSRNWFCLSCHVSSNQRFLISPAALTFFSGTAMQRARRRQSLQPPAKFYGTIPEALRNIIPSSSNVTPASGEFIDKYINPN